MRRYYPDKWKVIKLESDIGFHHRVFACWYGGYAGSDSWKLNSGITEVKVNGDMFEFYGSSGSMYSCHKDCYGSNMYGEGVLQSLITSAAENGTTITELPEDSDWINLTYE